MLTLNDGRDELWQWDTGRTLTVDADCSQVHFSNKVFGRSIDVDVAGGVAIIPDILLQTDKDLNVWAFVGTAESGYTKISKTFKVNRRNKPADYVFTPVEQTTIEEIAAIAQSVRDDADAGLFDGKDGYTPQKGVDYFDGEPGEKGDPFTYDDFTAEQLEAMRGPAGKDGQDYVLTADDRNEIAGIVETDICPTLTDIRETAEQAETIARGRATGYVFDTLADLETALTNEEFVAGLVVGDNLYIRATDVPDYWWDGTQKQQLEAEKPDLSSLVKDVQADGKTIVQDGVAKIPSMPSNASTSGDIVSGMVRLNGASYCGLSVPYAGAYMRLAVPSMDNIDKRSINSFPLAITLSTLDYAVKAAMCDGKGSAWTADEQAAARNKIGIHKVTQSEYDALTDTSGIYIIAEE